MEAMEKVFMESQIQVQCVTRSLYIHIFGFYPLFQYKNTEILSNDLLYFFRLILLCSFG